MKFEYPISKKLYLTIELSQFLSKHNCTFSEAKEILKLLLSEIEEQQHSLEYDTIEEYLSGIKSRDLDDSQFAPLNHCPPFC